METEFPKSSWWREEIHGASALSNRQHLRQIGAINRPKRGGRCGFKDYEKWKASQPPYFVEPKIF